MHGTQRPSLLLVWLLATSAAAPAAERADLILRHANIVTVDDGFSLAQAMAIRGTRILRIGDEATVLATRGTATRVIDLAGATVLPGLIDSHMHPQSAAMYEFDHRVPDMETIQDVLDYIRSRTQVRKEGEWIWVEQVFITRLREQRYPTREELDRVAPKHPVVFRTGPDAALNSLALAASGIDEDFHVVGPGHLERDPATGKLNGILRGCTRYIKSQPNGGRPATEAQRADRLIELLRDYLSVGLTTVTDRDASEDAVQRYGRLYRTGRLPIRVAISHSIDPGGPLDAVRKSIRNVAADPLARGDLHLRIVGVKAYLDGGMLTGSALMRKPWGISTIYSIQDPHYKGVRYIEPDRLEAIVEATIQAGLQFTAHAVGDGAVHALLEAYRAVAKRRPIRNTRPCISHSNFMSLEDVREMASLGVVADIQPAWLYLDARTLRAQFGDRRLRYFQPLKTIFAAGAIAGGGSDHMQKIGSMRAINPYNPFFGMWVTITRRARWFDGQLHSEEALNRQQAIRFYTINNAYITFRDRDLGSLEEGKLADLIVLDRNILTCDADAIKDIQVQQTYLDGKRVYQRPAGPTK